MNSTRPEASTLYFRFEGELNDFLPRRRQHTIVVVPFVGHGSVKDLIESLGVPHPEVAHIVVNQTPVDFGYLVQPGDAVVVYPLSMSNVVPLALRPRPTPRFILDVHLGRLAEYLRLLGFDTLYRNDYDDPTLATISAQEDRILLTRDVGLLKRGIVVHGLYVRATDPPKQVVEILSRFDLFDAIAPFQRCVRCNGLLRFVPKEAIADQLQPVTRDLHETFRQCAQCGQIYWQGSHYDRMQQFIDQVQRHNPRLQSGQ